MDVIAEAGAAARETARLFCTPEIDRANPIRDTAAILAFQGAAAALDTWPTGVPVDRFALTLICKGAEDAAQTIFLRELANRSGIHEGNPRMRNVSYSRTAFSDPDRTVRAAQFLLEDVDYDTMVGTGLSGALVVPMLARALGKKWAIIRKPGDGSHAEGILEGEVGKRWLFVDDFIATGATLARVRDQIDTLSLEYDEYPTFIGSYLYDTDPEFRRAPKERTS